MSHCVLDISVGAEDCNSDFVQNDENMVANILMHEIGHALGLGHTNVEDHLMYSPISPETSFDSKGYVIPERFDELYVGQKLLLIQEKEIQEKIESLDVQISDEQVLYDEYYEQYASYEGKTLPPKEYEQAQQAYDRLTLQTKKINTLILQQMNQLIKSMIFCIN